MKEKKNKKKLSRVGRIALDIIMVVCLGVAIFSGYQLYKGLASYNQAGNAYDNLRKNAVTTKKDTDKDDTTSTLDFQKLLEQNPDCAGWITLPNSNVGNGFPDTKWYIQDLSDCRIFYNGYG